MFLKIGKYFGILKRDIGRKGIFWSLVHRLYKLHFGYLIFSPIVNFLKPTHILLQGSKFFIDKKDEVISEELLISGKWEEVETDIFKLNLRPGKIVLDIGAHIGYYTIIAAKLVGKKGSVYSFEPDRKNFRLLEKNVKESGCKNIVLVNKAVSDKNNKGKLFLDTRNTGNHQVFDTGGRLKSENIQLITLDRFFRNKNNRVDFMKMDIQGNETFAFKGATNLIKKNTNLKMLIEFWPLGLSQSGSSAGELLKCLKQNKFRLFYITEKGRKVKEVKPAELLKLYTAKNGKSTNLLCIR